MIEKRFTKLKDYQDSYPLLLANYLNESEDNEEYFFIENELCFFYELIKPVINNVITEIESKCGEGTDLDKLQIKRYISTYKKIIGFLETKKTELKPNYQTVMTTENTLKWQGTELQFSELTKALFETKLISPELTQKEFFKRMKLFFNINEFDESDKIKEIVNRSSTPFINILEITLNNYKSKQLEKRKNK